MAPIAQVPGSRMNASLHPLSKGALLLSPWLYRAMIISLGLVFVIAGSIKLADPKAFARTISAYGFLPDELLVVVAIGLPLIEVASGFGLILGLRGSLPGICGLLALFITVLAYGVLNDTHVDCGCFSSSDLQEKNSLRNAIYRDIVFVAQAAYIYIWRRVNNHRVYHPLWSRKFLFFISDEHFRRWRLSDWFRFQTW